jgi:hypothetical protein
LDAGCAAVPRGGRLLGELAVGGCNLDAGMLQRLDDVAEVLVVAAVGLDAADEDLAWTACGDCLDGALPEQERRAVLARLILATAGKPVEQHER